MEDLGVDTETAVVVTMDTRPTATVTNEHRTRTVEAKDRGVEVDTATLEVDTMDRDQDLVATALVALDQVALAASAVNL